MGTCKERNCIIRLNDLQVIGSHNSYKIEIEKPLWSILYEKDSSKAKSLQYGHIPLEHQLNLGLRNLELDVFFDPKGGYYANPKGLAMISQKGKVSLLFDVEAKLVMPGLKMFHIQDIDFRSHHLMFKEGLYVLKQWSDANPKHTPVFVLINTKDKEIDNLKQPLKFGKSALDSLDSEIRNIFPEDKIITPDLVRGHFETLEQAILNRGWPTLDSVKGRFLFVLDENETRIKEYVMGHPSLKGRVLFTNSKEGSPEAAFRVINNPIQDFDYIKQLVEKGYMVRTRADAGTIEARLNDYSRFEQAMASGAQVISTDYYIPSNLFESQFKVIFENGKYEKIKAYE
ncbi:phosphatidylinositol-specific phospholipase C1-like protein [Aestuariibaculum sediminum]|uniref:phosphatidylinositol-specific phospholipase C1-like protein n=1 Tax=Aestuariibaculum sediminum TaxID=2770637 RepID=UPI001CB74494|nr:phosphatidylinositol-specific phospholipase C1-like protein [Aestuariibaculum sediminum]